MKERLKNYWKQNGFYTVLTTALVVVLSISGIAGYRSGIRDKATAENAAEFKEANQETSNLSNTKVTSESTQDPSNAVGETSGDTKAVNGPVAESFGEDTEMVMPVEGEVIKPFSMDTTIYFETLDQYKCNPAMLIQADVNQEVVAAFGGEVESIQEDTVNGTIITIDMGNGYKAVYGQMKDLDVKEADKIVKGQALGCVSEPTKYYTEEGSHLYFGMTKDETPVDPENYLAK